MSGWINDIEMYFINLWVMYIGVVGGGVWKIIDGGVIFFFIFDDYV